MSLKAQEAKVEAYAKMYDLALVTVEVDAGVSHSGQANDPGPASTYTATRWPFTSRSTLTTVHSAVSPRIAQ